jgi:hypothetical protein
MSEKVIPATPVIKTEEQKTKVLESIKNKIEAVKESLLGPISEETKLLKKAKKDAILKAKEEAKAKKIADKQAAKAKSDAAALELKRLKAQKKEIEKIEIAKTF